MAALAPDWVSVATQVTVIVAPATKSPLTVMVVWGGVMSGVIRPSTGPRGVGTLKKGRHPWQAR